MVTQLFTKLLATAAILCLVFVMLNVFNNFYLNIALLFGGMLFGVTWVLAGEQDTDNFPKSQR